MGGGFEIFLRLVFEIVVYFIAWVIGFIEWVFRGTRQE
jgi:hypothetical protein